MKKFKQHQFKARESVRGFGLVELMVAILISLLTVFAVVQMMSTYGKQERIGGSINETQNNALQALSIISTDAREAGFGFASPDLQNCINPATGALGVAASVNSLDVTLQTAAVEIVDGGMGPDVVTFRFSKGFRPNAPISTAGGMLSPDANIPVSSTFGIQAGQLGIVSDTAKKCTLFQVSSIANISNPKELVTDEAKEPANNYNPSPAPIGWIPYVAGSKVYPLGEIIERTYSVKSDSKVLQLNESVNLIANGEVALLVEGIVDLQVQYGIASPKIPGASSDREVLEWVSATGAIWSSPSVADRERIKAVRFAIVARSNIEDKNYTVNPIMLWPLVEVGNGAIVSNEQKYTPPNGDMHKRHRVLRAIIPLKNLQWGESS